MFILGRISHAQNNTNNSDTAQQVVVTKPGINRSSEIRWQTFADSINSYKATRIYPTFLDDACLDWNAAYWTGLHSPTSVRWKILLLVKDFKSLELLLKYKPQTLKTKCSQKWNGGNSYPGDLTPPLNDTSTYDLIKLRLKELH